LRVASREETVGYLPAGFSRKKQQRNFTQGLSILKGVAAMKTVVFFAVLFLVLAGVIGFLTRPPAECPMLAEAVIDFSTVESLDPQIWTTADFSQFENLTVFTAKMESAEKEVLFLHNSESTTPLSFLTTSDAGLTDFQDPSFSPDGRAVIFAARKNGQADNSLFIIGVEGGQFTELFDRFSESDTVNPVWGSWAIAYEVVPLGAETGTGQDIVIEPTSNPGYSITTSGTNPRWVMSNVLLMDVLLGDEILYSSLSFHLGGHDSQTYETRNELEQAFCH
jgi:hypothetical protein